MSSYGPVLVHLRYFYFTQLIAISFVKFLGPGILLGSYNIGLSSLCLGIILVRFFKVFIVRQQYMIILISQQSIDQLINKFVQPNSAYLTSNYFSNNQIHLLTNKIIIELIQLIGQIQEMLNSSLCSNTENQETTVSFDNVTSCQQEFQVTNSQTFLKSSHMKAPNSIIETFYQDTTNQTLQDTKQIGDRNFSRIQMEILHEIFGSWLIDNFDEQKMNNFSSTLKKRNSSHSFKIDSRYLIFLSIIKTHYLIQKHSNNYSIPENTNNFHSENHQKIKYIKSKLGREIHKMLEKPQTLITRNQVVDHKTKFCVYHQSISQQFIQTLCKLIRQSKQEIIRIQNIALHSKIIPQQPTNLNQISSKQKNQKKQIKYQQNQSIIQTVVQQSRLEHTLPFQEQSIIQTKSQINAQDWEDEEEGQDQEGCSDQDYEQDGNSDQGLNEDEEDIIDGQNGDMVDQQDQIDDDDQLLNEQYVYQALSQWLIKTYTQNKMRSLTQIYSQYYSSNYFHVGPRRQMLSVVGSMVNYYQKVKKYNGMNINDENVPQEIANLVPQQQTVIMGFNIAKKLELSLTSLRNTIRTYDNSSYFHVGPRYQMLNLINMVINQVKMYHSKKQNIKKQSSFTRGGYESYINE